MNKFIHLLVSNILVSNIFCNVSVVLFSSAAFGTPEMGCRPSEVGDRGYRYLIESGSVGGEAATGKRSPGLHQILFSSASWTGFVVYSGPIQLTPQITPKITPQRNEGSECVVAVSPQNGADQELFAATFADGGHNEYWYGRVEKVRGQAVQDPFANLKCKVSPAFQLEVQQMCHQRSTRPL
ncbi:MAG: hypothetical protein C5B49_02405 [Bdellovibrio sp.]|nr:MAG: hypothetical protein C5B49_02405 [Bdellovibrio sp.]